MFFNVDSLKEWAEPPTGIALALPGEYRTYALKGELYIEYLETDPTNGNQAEVEARVPNKNHVVFQIPFAQAYSYRLKGSLSRSVVRVAQWTSRRRWSPLRISTRTA